MTNQLHTFAFALLVLVLLSNTWGYSRKGSSLAMTMQQELQWQEVASFSWLMAHGGI
jgi:hypothetical protein